ncbi:MAG: polyprenol monophosphomannose synthase [Candidatus Helarchaeota archaeon]
MNKKITIVIPTYNEIDNLGLIINKILQIMKINIFNFEIIIVDDNSPDGTGILADQFSKIYKNIKVIHRKEKTGLGDAYKAGFKEARGDIIFEIDCDLSHDPNDIPRFIKALKNYDIIIGSRYIKGGSNINRSIFRILVSKVANILAATFFKLKLSDCTSGYRAYKKYVIDTIISHVNCQKYTFQVEMLEKAKKFGFRIGEIPIIFRERKRGQSKFNYSEIKEFLKVLFLNFPIIKSYLKLKFDTLS